MMRNRLVCFYTPTNQEINDAQAAYLKHEPRYIFYRPTTVLLELDMRGASSLTIAEDLGILLLTWNRRFYNQHRLFNRCHLLKIKRVVESHWSILIALRYWVIESLNSNSDQQMVRDVFKAFEGVLRQVGAAKCLHLLAPRFFPLGQCYR